MYKIRHFLNPMLRLGNGTYSYAIPTIGTLLVLLLLEFAIVNYLNSAPVVASLIIAISVILVVYFAFRDGIRGGVIATGIIIGYYIYIIFISGRVEALQARSSIQSTFFLGLLYLVIGSIIGWLKKSIDLLIIKEKIATSLADGERRRLKSVIEQMPVAIRIANIREKRVEGNEKLSELLKRKMNGDFDKEIKYMSEHEYKNGNNLEKKELVIFRALKSKKKIVSEEVEFIRDDRKKLFLRISASPVFDRRGKVISIVSVLDDVTGEKELQTRKDNFINMASHELKTPITTLKLYLDILYKRAKKLDNKSMTDPIENLRIQVERLQQLATDLLDISRIQTGKLRITKQKFLLNELIGEVCWLFQETKPDKKISIVNSNPIEIEGDRFRLYQVLTNLLTNAVKYSEKDKKIIIKSKQSDGHVQVSVKDHGIGLDPSEKHKIFNLLYQVKDAGEKTFPGLGMGLYISREIVRMHKGRIWVDSEKGKGSTFHFTLPTN